MVFRVYSYRIVLGQLICIYLVKILLVSVHRYIISMAYTVSYAIIVAV
uniref:Uncharacterized protein n=1 Tax=Anguilla anguilla TaxID=7936 RepID=A0A0E9TTG3_ANGAN